MTAGDIYNLIYSAKSKKTGRDVDYAIFAKGNYLYLAFRGTNSLKDVYTDIKYNAYYYKKTYVHQGFLFAWISAHNTIMTEFVAEKKRNPELRVRIIGHSLGGAMAILAAENYYSITGDKAELITLGCPKVVKNKASKEYFLSCVSSAKQYEYYNDPVPTVPPFFTHLNSIKTGEAFNLLKMTKNGIYYHTLYGVLNIQI